MLIQPYLFFDGRCDEAIEFYTKALGAKVSMLMRFKDVPADAPKSDDPNCRPPVGAENKVMHACIEIGPQKIMASDGECGGKAEFKGFGLSLTVKSEGEAKKLFGSLNDGGHVITPLTKTFFSPAFGMVADKFGVMWMVVVEQ